jgi:hypothetical protein
VDRLGFVAVDVEAFLINVMTKERHLAPVQLTLLQFSVELMFPEEVTHGSEVFLVVFQCLRKY